MSDGRKRTAKVAQKGYFLYIGGMFVLLQYSVFDLRIRNNPEFLTIPFKTWPHIEDGFRFVNNFGRIREKDETELFNWVLEEHHAYVEVNSLKFEDLQATGDPFTIQGDHRRIYFDDYGGIRLCIGFDIRMKPGHSIEKLEDLIQHLSKKKIRIKSPEKRTKSVQLDNLTASFKNLFVYSISQKDHVSQAKHLSKSQAPQVQVHLSEEEFERFDKLNSFHQYPLSPQAFLYYKSLDIGKRQADCIVTFGEQEVEKKQFSRYALGHFLGLEEDLESLLEFQNSDISLGADAKTSFSKLREDYLDSGRLDEWKEINDIYQEIAGNRYDRLKEAYENKFLPSSSKKVQANKTEMESSIRNLIISGEFEEALDKMELMASPQNLNRVYVLRATYNKYEQELAQGILSHDQKQQRFSIVVTDSLNLLTFLEKQRAVESQQITHNPQDTKEKKDLDSPKKIFFAYSKKDREYLEDLKNHLATLRRQGKVELWDDHEILPGDEWDNKINIQLEAADIVLFLLSANMLATDYVWEEEIPLAMRLRKEGKLRVIPIVLKNCDWESTELGELNGLPRKGQPVNTFKDPDTAWDMVVTEIRRVL